MRSIHAGLSHRITIIRLIGYWTPWPSRESLGDMHDPDLPADGNLLRIAGSRRSQFALIRSSSLLGVHA